MLCLRVTDKDHGNDKGRNESDRQSIKQARAGVSMETETIMLLYYSGILICWIITSIIWICLICISDYIKKWREEKLIVHYPQQFQILYNKFKIDKVRNYAIQR